MTQALKLTVLQAVYQFDEMNFQDFLSEGFQHILDPKGYDHMLFLLALVAGYTPRDWRKFIALATSFTIGHSITLALVVFKLVKPNTSIIEWLIPVSILLTALLNLRRVHRKHQGDENMAVKFLITLFFGLIHGLGFSTYLKMLLGKTEDLGIPLLGFNLGVEAGQLLFLLAFFIILLFVHSLSRIKHRDWIIFVSGGCAFMSLFMSIEAWPF